MERDSNHFSLFLCGDVMTGRGIDQALRYPVDPRIYESYVKDARDYLYFAETQNGRIITPVSFAHIWGDALKELEKRQPDLRIINLETSITTSNDYWEDKGINYRMHPRNVPCLTAAKIDGCALANNHVLDWGYAGLTETLATLTVAGIHTAGAGQNEEEAAKPIIWERKKGRVLFFSFGSLYSGVPWEWMASGDKPGINSLEDFSVKTVQKLKEQIEAIKKPNDVVIFSVHWGGNWGYKISNEHRQFSHQLIDEAGVDLIHGHSSHHFKGIEVYNGKLILYGCGDFINDYEGIDGKETYRGDLVLMYFPVIDPSNGQLIQLEIVPMVMRNFRLNAVNEIEDRLWIKEVLTGECGKLGTTLEMVSDRLFKINQ